MEAGKVESAARRHQAAQLFPLFPYAEPKRSYDVWGETLTEEEVRMLTGQAGQAAPLLSAPTSAAAAPTKLADAMHLDEPEITPTKSVVHPITVRFFFFFAGDSRAWSLRLFLPPPCRVSLGVVFAWCSPSSCFVCVFLLSLWRPFLLSSFLFAALCNTSTWRAAPTAARSRP
jgi:hypothetical protein